MAAELQRAEPGLVRPIGNTVRSNLGTEAQMDEMIVLTVCAC